MHWHSNTNIHLQFVKASENPVSAIPGYTMETLQWSVDVFPGQTELLNGTVQEVYAQALQINPHFELSKTDGMDLDETTPDIQNSVIHCGIYRPRAEKGRILEGVRYLHSLPGRPKIRPGPRRCVRVSCSYGGAIVWCNDVSRKYTCNIFLSLLIICSVGPYRLLIAGGGLPIVHSILSKFVGGMLILFRAKTLSLGTGILMFCGRTVRGSRVRFSREQHNSDEE